MRGLERGLNIAAMRRCAALLALLLAGPPVPAQVTIVAPGSDQGRATRPSEASYGPPRVIEMEALAMMPESYNRTHVIVEGEFSELGPGQYWVLRQTGTSLLVIPGREFDAGQLSRTTGRRMEARGIIRVLRKKQYVGKPPTDLDLLEDPLLPPMPAPSAELPRVSLTVLAVRDRTAPETFNEPETGGGIPRRILEEPAAYLGKTTKILGQFRGRNLFGDLPANSARGKDDWVLKDGDTAVWVMGKAPRGDGWKLDLDYKGDSKNWLEVEGKAEVVNGVVYLKASRVIPSRAPGSQRRGPGPR